MHHWSIRHRLSEPAPRAQQLAAIALSALSASQLHVSGYRYGTIAASHEIFAGKQFLSLQALQACV